MSDDDVDVIYLHGRDSDPQVKGCVMHPFLACSKIFDVDSPVDGYRGVNYGLCPGCLKVLGDDPKFQDDIDAEIELRLNKLKGEN